MRRLLHDEAFKRGIDWIKVDERTWESVPHDRAQNLDLILTCISLHLTGIGFEAALEKVFHSLPKHVFVVTEFSPEIRVIWPHQRYSLVFAKHYETESSFAYHSAGEAVAHHAYKKGGLLTLDEESLLRTKLACKDGHLWLADSAYVGMYWWQRTE
jgi:hypothetical protein